MFLPSPARSQYSILVRARGLRLGFRFTELVEPVLVL